LASQEKITNLTEYVLGDEVKKPQTRLPWTMIISISSNSLMMFVYMIILMFTLGDPNEIIQNPLPIVEVYYRATKYKHASNFLVVAMAWIVFVSMFNIFASVSRLIWSFALDKGLPFSRYFDQVS